MRQQYEEALEQFDKAIQLSYRNPLLRFKRAKTLVLMGRFQDALEELEKTKDLAPKEASVYRLLSDVHKELGNKQQSLMVSLQLSFSHIRCRCRCQFHFHFLMYSLLTLFILGLIELHLGHKPRPAGRRAREQGNGAERRR